ncbi:G1 family glutamic endopeptidase [Actinomadura hibisca]|uniref:G1 family glutamic endopeptidase n=1 Tax=Actinomadura hibisca TaxID=68565 RepID=UPI000A040BEE|nr:G1 family glutamic endopeptidase [Actinomadura hibisca]
MVFMKVRRVGMTAGVSSLFASMLVPPASAEVHTWISSINNPGCALGTSVKAPRNDLISASDTPEKLREEGVHLSKEAIRLMASKKPRWLRSIQCSQGPKRELPTLKPSRQHTEGALADMSTNWAGYKAEGGKQYTDVSARWKVPAVTLQNQNGMSAIWPGIGTGIASDDPLIQAGTTQEGTYSSGKMSYKYRFWYEAVPYDPAMVFVNLAVKPGDEVYVAISRTTTYAYFTIYNLTANVATNIQRNFNQTIPETSGVVEWVNERVRWSNRKLSLQPKYSIMHMTNATASYLNTDGVFHDPASPIALNAQPVTMTGCDLKTILATAGPLYVEGEPYAGLDTTWKGYGKEEVCQ